MVYYTIQLKVRVLSTKNVHEKTLELINEMIESERKDIRIAQKRIDELSKEELSKDTWIDSFLEQIHKSEMKMLGLENIKSMEEFYAPSEENTK